MQERGWPRQKKTGNPKTGSIWQRLMPESPESRKSICSCVAPWPRLLRRHSYRAVTAGNCWNRSGRTTWNCSRSGPFLPWSILNPAIWMKALSAKIAAAVDISARLCANVCWNCAVRSRNGRFPFSPAAKIPSASSGLSIIRTRSTGIWVSISAGYGENLPDLPQICPVLYGEIR